MAMKGFLRMMGLPVGDRVGKAAGEDVKGVQNGLALVDRDRVEQSRHAGAARSRETCGGTLAGVGEHELHGTLIVRMLLAPQPAALDQRVGEATDHAAIQP